MNTKLTGPRKKTKCKTITIRIPSDIFDEIEKISSYTHQTISDLVREQVIKLARWEVHASKLGMMPVPMKILNLLIEEKTEEQIKTLSSLSFELLKEWTLVTKQSLGLNQCIEAMEDFMSISKMNVTHRKVLDEHIFDIKHNMHKNWSIFGMFLLRNVFDEFSATDYEFKHEVGTLIAKNTLGKDFNEHEY